MKVKNYIETAKQHETIFRLILARFRKNECENLSIDEIFNKFSTGDRRGIWTILDFHEVKPNIFEFSCESIAFLSGGGQTDWWTIKKGELHHVGNLSIWMS